MKRWAISPPLSHDTADIEAAIALAMALGFAIDPALAALIAPIA
jgi:hypothetical protein